MPPFEFKGKDASGESHSGTIDAPSHAAAQATLKSRGITVVLLRPAGSGPQMGAPNASGSYPVPKMGPPSGSFPVPNSIQPASPAVSPAAWSEASRGRGMGRVRGVLIVVALLGVLGAAAAGYAFTQPQGDVRLQKGETEQVLSFTGRVTFAKQPKTPDPWRNVHVSFVLPEVPAEAILGRSELAFNAVGDFTVKIHFLSAITPHILNVQTICRGYRPESVNNLKIADDTSHATSVPTMTLETARRRPSNEGRADSMATPTPEATSSPHQAQESEPEAEPAK